VRKKATLYTSATLNGAWLLISIDAALWLHKSDGYKEITICCVSNYNPLNFFSLLLRVKNLSTYLTKNKFKKLINFLNSSNSKKDKLSELASFATGRLDQASLVVDDLEIKFVRAKLGKKNSVLNFLTLSYRTIFDYLNYFRKSALKNKTYLKYQVANIYSGLYVLSEALRSDYKSFGSIFHCRFGILAALYRLHSSVKEYKDIVLSKESDAFVCGPSQEYVYGFFSRFMSDRGAYFIDTSGTQEPFIKLKLKEKYYLRLKIYQIGDDVLTLKSEKISEYYKSRIERPWEKLYYMSFLKDKLSNKEAIKDKLFNKEAINLNRVTVIVYLHSFTDAQYIYGYDGYHDLMDWCLNTISLLNSNEHVSRVIVKPHPGVNPVYHPGDVIANKHLRSRISGFDKVQWADFHFDVTQIKGSGLAVGITHYGSVAEELVFHKIPVIASTYSPWGEEYKFGYWWNNPKEYEELISSKSITELVVTKTQTDELYRYVMDRYFNLYSDTNFEIDSTWQDMLKVYGIAENSEFGENFNKINILIAQLDPEERKFKEYITTRLQRISSLKDNNILKT